MTSKQKKTLVRICVGFALLIFAVVAERTLLTGAHWTAVLAVYLAPYLVIGADVLLRAGRNILAGQVFDENFLMCVATLGAFAIGDSPEAVAVMLFYQVGELFQGYAVNRSRKSIGELMKIRPDYANVERNGEVATVDPTEVCAGDIIVIRPGERVPLDGVIVEGHTALDTTALTGESAPRDARVGDEVISGCLNGGGLLRVRVSKPFGESTVSKILELVESASDRKAKSEQFITGFARVYTPLVVGAAVLLAVFPPLLTDRSFITWIERALTFLVISCPCALVISVPLSFFGGIGGASRRGILIKGGNYMETLANTEIVVMDKTGTLTKGNFAVTKVHPEPAGNIGRDRLLEIAALAECYSSHPIAASLREAYNRDIDHTRVSEVEERAGEGVLARVDGKRVACGNARLVESVGAACHECHTPGTNVHVAVEGIYAGHILITDELKSEAAQAIEQLRRAGVKKTVMLTGDNRAVGEYVAGLLKLDVVYSALLPTGKVEKLEALMKEKSPRGKVMFVGDGINDAPVLARADIGVAMGALGADAAIEAADVVLMDDNPRSIALAINIARRTLRIVRQNVVFALSVKAAVLALGALGMANMWAAVFADVGVSVIAIINASRALSTSALD